MKTHIQKWGNSLIEPEYMLEELIAQITDENRHSEVSTGISVGNEECIYRGDPNG